MQNDDLENVKNFVKKSEIDDFIEKYELKRLHTDFVERVLLFIIAGFGLISALAWDNAFKDIFGKYFGDMNGIGRKIFYALVLSSITALLTLRLNKIFRKRKK